jgi:hypothetical protein
VKEVAATAREKGGARRIAVLERSAQLQDVVLDDLRGRRRRPLAPELVDDPVGREHLVAMEEK